MRVGWTLVTFTTLVLIGCSGSDKSAKDKIPDKKGETVGLPKEGEEVAKAPADFSLSSEDFFKEYQKDRKAADAKYVARSWN